jgi:CheY-like chemotaxis protein
MQPISICTKLITAGSGKEALRQVLLHEFAVILLDVSMPGMDGFETAEAIHSHPRSAGTPIIFITAHYATMN